MVSVVNDVVSFINETILFTTDHLIYYRYLKLNSLTRTQVFCMDAPLGALLDFFPGLLEICPSFGHEACRVGLGFRV